MLVQDPRGHRAEVDPDVQIEVNPSTPDHVVFLPDEKQWLSANSTLTLNMVAVDDKNLPYPIAGHVTVTVGSPGILITETSLGEAEEVSYSGGKAMVSGYLDNSGQATMTIACEDPSTCTALPPFLVTVHAPPEWPGASTLGSVEVEVVESYSALRVSLLDASASELIPYTVVAGQAFRVQIVAQGLNDTGDDDSGQPPEVHGEVLLFDTVGVIEYVETLPDNPEGCFPSSPLVLQSGIWSGTITCYTAVEDDRLIAVGPLQKYGESRHYDVVSGEAARLQVDTQFMESSMTPSGYQVEAGTPFWIRVTPLDAYGNAASFPADVVPSVDDSAASLTCREAFDPETWQFSDCTINLANEGDVIHGQAGDVQGESRPFDVVPGKLFGLTFDPLPSKVIAGDQLSVRLWASDRYGNPVGQGSGFVVVQDQPVDPEMDSELVETLVLTNGFGNGVIQLKRAVSETKLEAWYGDYEGESNHFAVVAGPARSFRVAIEGTEDPPVIVAGEQRPVTVTAQDLYNNLVTDYEGSQTLYLVPTGTELEGSGETMAWFQDGVAELVFVPIRASDSARLQVNDASGVSGTSDVFRVVAGEAAGFAFDDVPVVVWMNRPFSLTLRAVDPYGNQVTTCNPVVRLDDWTGSLDAVGDTVYQQGTVTLEDGLYRGTFVLATVATSDALVATTVGSTSGCQEEPVGFQSTSSPFPVYDLDCEDPPATTLSTGGRDNVAVACEGDSVPFTASSQSDDGILDVVWTFDDGSMSHGPYQWDVKHVYESARYYRPAVSAVDHRLCASWVEAEVYVGVNDGSPTGPMTMRKVQGTEPLVAGADDGSQIATVEVQATDCREDSASYPKSGEDGDGFQITVLPTVGDLQSGDVSDRPGIQYLLGPYTGTVQFDYSVGNTAYGGMAHVVAVYEKEGEDGEPVVLARGSVAIEVGNDHVPPHVVSYSPAGAFFSNADVVTARFTEAIRPDNLTTPEVLEDVNDGEDPIVEVLVASGDSMGTFVRWPISAITLDSTGRFLSLHLGQTIDLERSWYQVRVRLSSAKGAPSITDTDGNPLDGDWDGTHAVDPETGMWVDDFSWRFGRLDTGAVVPLVATCSVSQPTFSPDGQDGEGEEADSTVFSGTVALRTPLKAVNIVVDPPGGGDAVASLWSPVPGGDNQTQFQLVWTGTGMDGQRLPNGDYTYQVHVVDTDDNWLYGVCGGQVEIRNPVDLGDFL